MPDGSAPSPSLNSLSKGSSKNARASACSGAERAQFPSNGTVAQAAKMPMVAVTPTEVLEAMHHCMPSEVYPYSTSRACPK